MFKNIIFLVWFIIMLRVATELTGDNVCRTEVTTPEIAVQWQVRNGTVRSYQWCWNVPPRCSVYKKQFWNETKEVVRNVTKLIEFCCEGYKEQDDVCVPEHESPVTVVECLNCTTENILDDNFNENVQVNNSSTVTEESGVIFVNLFDGDSAINSSSEKNENNVEAVDESPIFYIRNDNMESTTINQSEDNNVSSPDARTTSDKSEGLNSNSEILFITTQKITMSFEDELFPENHDVLSHSREYPKTVEILDTEEKYYSSTQNTNELIPRNNSYVLHGVIIALTGSVVIIILAMIILTVNNTRNKKNKGNTQKSVKHVAVYTTSIFHTPLPEPPTFDNPTYLTTSQPFEDTQYQNNGPLKTFEPVLSNISANPHITHLKESRDYVYDHPPSTGSYRAASSVDGLSILDESSVKIQPEPLYDEIPSKDENIQPESLYMNTLCRTRF